MPEMSQANKESLNRFVSEYNDLPWYKRIFYPRALGAALKKYHENPSQGSAFTVCDAFLNKTWAIQRWFFSSISFFSSSELAKALSTLNSAGLLTDDTAQANFNAVAGHQNARDVALVLGTLNSLGLLTGDAAQANRNAVAGHQNPGEVALALGHLKTAGLLTGDAAQANFNAVAGHQSPNDVASALRALNSDGLLTGDAAQANFNAVAGHQSPAGVAWALWQLNDAGLLTGDAAQANFNAMAGRQNPWGFARALSELNRAGLLTQDSFNWVVITHAAILVHGETGHLWTRIPGHLLTEAHFAAIIAICNDNQGNPAEGRRQFTAYVNQTILGMAAQQPGVVGAFNPGQSTHTASVHKSVSESAIRLRTLYNDNIMGYKLERVIKDISTWLTEVPGDSLQIMAAKRCFPRLTAVDYTFTDPESLVSTRQLLALAWIAIHDESKRHQGTTLDDAKALLLQGLYEIQRGYNISGNNVDNNAPNDLSICVAGTFNKIIEKLQGVHSLAAIHYITMEGAGLKLQAVVRDEAMSYLKSLLTTETGRQQLEEIVGKMKEQNHYDVEAIFPEIKTAVANRLFDEFGVLFSGGKASDSFSEFIEEGENVLLHAKDVLALLNPPASTTSASGFFGGGASAGGGPDDTNKPTASPSL